VDTVVGLLRRIGEAHGDRTPSQVALAWLIAKGAVPIPGAKNKDQAQQNAGALGWRLTGEELDLLTSASLDGRRGLSQRIWQHG
jgi:diketogulonate reductase-like aldo/keto reductase